MPRKDTQVTTTNRWIRAQDWLGIDQGPMVQLLRGLAATMDRELDTTGQVKAATASAYRSAYQTLMDLRPNSQRIADQLAREDDSLMTPTDWTAGR